MRGPLQDFGDSAYLRPQQPWRCGLDEQGRACPSGPRAGGICPALAHCSPVQIGDRWQCNRSPIRGGPCDEGPAPDGTCPHVDVCSPIRSMRNRRGRFVVTCTLFAVGAALMIASANWRAAVIVPGPLAHNHAQILAERATHERCATCHEAAEGDTANWLLAAVWHSSNKPTQSTLCMNCHKDSLPADLALLAHNVPPETLNEMTRKRSSAASSVVAAVVGRPTNGRGEIACSRCHREHHGTQFDLTAISDAACQACHTERYHSFATDHPDFSLWPYERRTRIVFDHASHSAKHFPTKNADFVCSSCHVESASGDVQLLASYETACAACHDEQVAATIGTGIAMLSLPMIDDVAFRDQRLNIGDWPAAATGEFDGPLSPAMKILLAADPTAAAAMRALGEDFEFADVDPGDAAQVRAAAVLATAIKRLFANLAADVREHGTARVAAALGTQVEPNESRQLFAGLSPEVVQTAAQLWLPEVSSPLGRDTPPQTQFSTQHQPLTTLNFSPPGSWHRDDDQFALRYQPAGHADPLLTAWLDALVAAPPSSLVTALINESRRPNAAGMCLSCHSIDRRPDGNLAVNWLAADRSGAPRPFTRFTHAPHVLQPLLADCTHCHQVDMSSDSSVSYAHYQPRNFVSDFRPMTKSQCTACHTKTAAGDRCQSCHNYHVGTAAP